MVYVGQVLLFAFCAASALVLGGAALGGVASGRIKTEASESWISLREQPGKFCCVVALYSGFATLFVVGGVAVFNLMAG